jgi:hypothetical protein
VAGFCEHGNEPLGPIQKADFFDKLSDCQLFNNVLHHGVGKVKQVASNDIWDSFYEFVKKVFDRSCRSVFRDADPALFVSKQRK